ncbi:phage tail length tape measure family protein [Afipia felis]|uniref:Prophage tail length tape measure protein n=2 Tax=Afipia felis TaxID=1035 RepID=A0A380W9D3_AFIFE|nr:phage tail length tape measure family protein [Afipia felis]EKS28237.1 lambda family phage tail tape measure protein [Afipia felis ATCC 53690]SUU76947.1 Prophage tail length tape measure protein [Afipia felis]SUU85013.1 Prophage tail length tape measure protein [Afipia felis]
MAVKLSALRVTSDFDASGYTRGAQQKVAADTQMIASDKARHAMLAQVDAAMSKAIPGMASLSKSLLDGYSAGQQFTGVIQRIGNAVDRGMGLDRTNALLDAAYRKFGLTADAVQLAEHGYVSIAPAVDQLNSKLRVQEAFATDVYAAMTRLNSSQQVQNGIDAHLGIGANDNLGRADDIAALGSSLDSLRAKYSPLYAAQQQYRAALGELNSLEARVALSEMERATAIARVKDAFAGQVVSIKGAASATGLAAYQMQNLGYQVNDVITMLAIGSSPFQILATQGGQVYQILAGANGGVSGALRSVASNIAGMITPTRLAIGGAVALGAAGVAVYESWKKTELEFDAVARQAGVTLNFLHSLDQAGAVKGIGTDDMFGGVKGFSAQLYQAKANMGGLADVMAANGVKAAGFQQTLMSIADIIRDLPNDQARLNVLQQAGLPTTFQWLQFMRQGGDGIKAATDDVVLLGSSIDQNMVAKARAFDEAWSKTWKNFKSEFSSGFIELYGFFDNLNERALMAVRGVAMAMGVDVKGNLLRSGKAAGTQLTNAQVIDFQDAVGLKPKAGAGGSVDPAVLKQQISLEQQRIGILGATASIQDVVRGRELDIASARLNHIVVTDREAAALKALAAENALGLTAMRQQADQLRIQSETLGMSAGQAAAYTAVQNRLAEAVRNHQTLTESDVVQIRAQAAALGIATEAAERARVLDQIRSGRATALLSSDDVQIAQQLRGLYPDVATALSSVEAAGLRTNQALSGVSSTLSGSLTTGLADIADGTKSITAGAGDMQKAVIRALDEMLIKMTIVTPAMRALQAVMTSFGISGVDGFNPVSGLTGAALGNGFTRSGLARFATGGAFTNQLVDQPTLFRFAQGGGMSLGLMGEAGPEAVMPLRRGPGGRLGVEMVGASNDNVGTAPRFNFKFNNAPAGTSGTGSASPNKDGGFDIEITFGDAVRGIVRKDLSTGTGLAPDLKTFAQASRFSGG